MAIMQRRQPARKFWVADILNSEQVTTPEGYRNYRIRGKDTARVNIIAGVIEVYANEQKSYAAATLDDGSAQIRLKAWNEDALLLKDLHVGDIVLTIGRLNANDLSNSPFIRPEIIRPLSIAWMELRRAELQKEYGQPQEVKQQPQEEAAAPEETVFEERVAEEKPSVPLATREKIVQMIESNSSPEGVAIQSIIQNSGISESEAQAAINELLREGEAFQLKQGFLKLIS